MIVKLYSFRDKLIAFNPPIGFKDERVAARWFESECKKRINLDYTSPRYYELYEIGTMDTDTGLITAYPKGEIKLILEGEQYERE